MLRQQAVGEAPIGTGGRPGAGRADLAMNVLQYGTAILAIVAVTLLSVIR